MKAMALCIRISPFVLACTLGLLNLSSSPAFSQPPSEGMPIRGPALEGAAIVRMPPTWSSRPAADNVFFTSDIAVGLNFSIFGARVHDRWTWRYHDPDGSLYSGSCFIEVRGPGEEGNDSLYPVLITNCATNPVNEWEVLEYFGADCPCYSADSWSAGLPVESHAVASRPGIWTVAVDYTDPDGHTTNDWLQDSMYLRSTPTVILIPGYNEHCATPEIDSPATEDQEPSTMGTLQWHLVEELGVSSDRVQCYEYDTRKGVVLAAMDLVPFVRWIRAALGMDPSENVDFVGHSLGGLVARYYTEVIHGSSDGPIGSINMLGTPNDGVWIAQFEKWLCPAVAAVANLWGLALPAGIACAAADWLDLDRWGMGGFDPDSQGVTDATPGSLVLHGLNDSFALPSVPVYRARAGLHSTLLGHISSGSDTNDCLVSRDSVAGPRGIFARVLATYPWLTHAEISFAGITICEPPTLLNDSTVVSNVASTIRGVASVAPDAVSLTQGESQASAGPPFEQMATDFVQPNQSKTSHIEVPAGLSGATFLAFWLDNYPRPELGFTLRRPDGTVVAGGDPDVTDQVDVTGDNPFYVLMHGFGINNPVAGDWQIEVQGTSVPDQGQVYVAALMPDSQVALSTDVGNPYISQGQPQLITAEMFDGTAAVAATDISANVTTPAGDEVAVTLRDDGTGGDETAGDRVYSGTFGSTEACGGYGLTVSATGNSSEGVATRQQVGFFQTHVPGDAIRDPCNPDEDEDGLTDAQELNTVGTDPLNADTDGDDMPDGYEYAHACLDPLSYDADADPDGDGQSNLSEYDLGTNPCSAGPSVGGIAEAPDVAESAGHGPSSMPYAIAGASAVVVMLAAGGWHARRRRQR